MHSHPSGLSTVRPPPGMRLSLLTGALAALLGGAPAQAQMGGEEPGMGSPAMQLREVVVTGRRTLEERFMATGSLVVVDRQDIERMGVDSAVDALKQLPGVQVNTNASGGVEIRMRGMEASATRVLIDGQRGAGRGQLPIDQLPADLIERIEVVRSPSAEFAGASGGTINIVLRQANPQRSAMVRLTDVVAWGEHRARLWASRAGPLGQAQPEDPRAPSWSYFSGLWLADQLNGSDVTRERFTDGTATGRTEATGRYARQDWFLIQRLNGRIGRDQLTLRGSLRGSEGSGRYETRDGAGTQLETSTQQSQSWQLGSDWTRRLDLGKLETSLSGNGQNDEQQRQGITRYAEDRKESTWLLKSKLSGARSETLLWMAGLEHETRQAHGTSRSGSNPQEALRSEINRTALWGQNEWEIARKTTLTAGLRGETVQLGSAVDGLQARQHLDIWQPSLHARTPVGKDAQWRLNLARITRQPNVNDLLDRTVPSVGTNSLNNPNTAGNPKLRPEVTQTLDLAWEQRLTGQGQYGLTLFTRTTDDVIASQVFESAGAWVEQRQNIGSARLMGLEADVKKPLAGAWSAWMLSATATATDSQLTSGPRSGQSIPGQARYTASLNLAKPMRRGGGYFGGAGLTLTGPAPLNTSVATGTDRARTTVDVHVGQSVNRMVNWRVGIYNLGDAPQRRSRQYVSNGQTLSELSTTSFTPRIFASLGLQF
jgi:outer membrane receptor for ferrienterochelin and colicins